MSKRLSDTEALSSKSLKPARMCLADEPEKYAFGSADLAVQKPRAEDYSFPSLLGEPEAFRSTGVGTETLSAAKAALK